MPFIFRPVLIIAAVVPAVILMIYVYRADRLEGEPPHLLWRLFLAGLAATFLASLTEQLGSLVLSWFTYSDPRVYYFLLYFLVVAGSEEGFKYLLMKQQTWYSESFNCQYDAIVYAFFVSLGFALLENVQYVLIYGFGTAMLRAVTAVPGHACFGVFMGVWYGMAKKNDNYGYPQRSRFFRVLSLLIPLLLHGFYDYVASMEEDSYTTVFIVFIALMFLTSFLLVRRFSRHDSYID